MNIFEKLGSVLLNAIKNKKDEKEIINNNITQNFNFSYVDMEKIAENVVERKLLDIKKENKNV